jgi:hypothetical protein
MMPTDVVDCAHLSVCCCGPEALPGILAEDPLLPGPSGVGMVEDGVGDYRDQRPLAAQDSVRLCKRCLERIDVVQDEDGTYRIH